MFFLTESIASHYIQIKMKVILNVLRMIYRNSITNILSITILVITLQLHEFNKRNSFAYFNTKGILSQYSITHEIANVMTRIFH